MKDFEKAIDYTFNNKSLLREALTHSSYANEHRDKHIRHNERLEFLGDAVLSIVVADYIFKNCPNLPEGELTKLRSALVCEKALYKFGKQIDLGSYLFLSKGEKNGGGADRPSIVSDAFEAVIAAIYLDGGIEPARKHILRFVVPEVKNQNKKPPDHDKHFVFQVLLNSNIIGRGGGRSKKEAEQNAAHEALELMGY